MTETLKSKIHFTLSEKINCIVVPPTPAAMKIETATDKNHQKSITGFTIQVTDTSQKASIAAAESKARIFVDLLSTLSRTASNPLRDETPMEKPDDTNTGKFTINLTPPQKNDLNLHISKKALEQILDNQIPALTRQMRHVNNALGLLKNNKPASAHNELILACDESPEPIPGQYGLSRTTSGPDVDKVSDDDDDEDMMKVLEFFADDYQEFTPEKKINYSPEENKANYMKTVICLLNEMITCINDQILELDDYLNVNEEPDKLSELGI